jgi:hypothetical protein
MYSKVFGHFVEVNNLCVIPSSSSAGTSMLQDIFRRMLGICNQNMFSKLIKLVANEM